MRISTLVSATAIAMVLSAGPAGAGDLGSLARPEVAVYGKTFAALESVKADLLTQAELGRISGSGVDTWNRVDSNFFNAVVKSDGFGPFIDFQLDPGGIEDGFAGTVIFGNRSP